jgi:mRNA interferase RelE/StbE
LYKVELRRNVIKYLEKLERGIRGRINEALLTLEEDPRPRDIEKVRGTELFRTREGDYRIVYDINDQEKVVTVVRIGHRREIYREL